MIFPAAGETSEVFVFPLRGLVFFPTTSLPLNIFEPRYLEMVRDALAEGKEIAICPVDPLPVDTNDRHPAELVVGAGKPQLLEERSDGTLLIALKGTRRLRLGAVIKDTPYIRAFAEDAPLDRTLSADGSVRLTRIRRRLDAWMTANIPNQEWREKFLREVVDPLSILEHATLYLVEDVEIRQLMQELGDLESRVKLLDSRILGTYATGSTEVN